MLRCCSATRLPSTIVSAARAATIHCQSSSTGMKAPEKSRSSNAKPATFDVVER